MNSNSGKPSPSPAIGDVEKLIRDFAYQAGQCEMTTTVSLPVINTLRSLAAEKANYEASASSLNGEVTALHQKIASLRAKLERAREGLTALGIIGDQRWTDSEAQLVELGRRARATLEELK